MFFRGGHPNIELIIGLGLAMMVLTFWLVYLAARNKLSLPEPLAGQLFVFRDPLGRFGAAKVLAVNAALVHFRVFSNRWPKPPRGLPVDDLFISRSPDEEDWGSEHAVVTLEQYRKMALRALDVRRVTDEELQPYQAWVERSSKGGLTSA